MNKILYTVLGLLFIFLMTTLGSSLVFFFKKDLSKGLKQIFLGFASGIMISASIFSLLIPSINSTNNIFNLDGIYITIIGFILGAIFLWLIDKIVPHFHKEMNEEEGLKTKKMKKTTKMFLAVTIHNIPEGLSVGIAFGIALASSNDSLIYSALMLALGIGIQNFPEGTAVALPFKEECSTFKSFLMGMFSGLVEPIMGIVGFFLSYYIEGIIGLALSFAAGAMIYVTIEELIPESQLDSIKHNGTWSFIFGFLLMMFLDVILG